MFIYCQQHAREWVTPITCLETAERLVRNYATDPTTKAYVDNLDIFILPSSNPDGAHYSMYDSSVQRKNMVNYCPVTATTGMPSGRNAWGVDLNRNNTIGSLFDGYSGASTACNSETYAGPFETSEAGDQERAVGRGHVPEDQVRDQHPHPRRLLHVGAGRVHPAGPRDAAGAEHRDREVLLRRVGDDPVAHQVVARHGRCCRSARARSPTCCTRPRATRPMSQYYRKGIIAYSFEAGAQRISVNPTTGAITKTERRLPAVLRRAGDQRRPGRQPAAPSPRRTRCWSTRATTRRWSSAEGNYGLLQGALEYSQDVTPPKTTIEYSAAQTAGDPINFRFNWVDEPSVIYYTTDGSTPTVVGLREPDRRPTRCYSNQGPRRPGEVLTLSALGAHTIKWMSVDIKGNQEAVQSQRLLVAADDAVRHVERHGAARRWRCRSARRRRSARSRRASTSTYTASTTANVISTAGNGVLSVSDPSSTTRASWSTARSRWRSRCRPRRRACPAPAGRSLRSVARPARRRC